MFDVGRWDAMDAQHAGDVPPVVSRAHRRRGNIAAAVTLALVCSGVTSCTRTQVALSVTAIAAVLVVTTVGVTLAVQHSHHVLQGCIAANANGLELRLSDGKYYGLKGDLADVKVGDKLKLHGTRVKRVKGDTADRQVFLVEQVNKNYGPCLNPVPKP